MHVLLLKSDNPNIVYRLSNNIIPFVCLWFIQDAGTPSEATPTLQDTTPTRQGKKKPVVPPRPHKRQNRSHTLNTPDQSECSIQRESVDGEYVCPNALVNIRTFRSQSSSEGEVIQVDNQDIAMSPNTAALRDSKGYLTLYMSPEN